MRAMLFSKNAFGRDSSNTTVYGSGALMASMSV